MKFLLFLVLLLNTSSTVISIKRFNDKILLQPVPSSGMALRKVPRPLPRNIRIPTKQNWPDIIFLKNLFELECLKEINVRGRPKNRLGSKRPDFFVPGPQGPAFKTFHKNQGNTYNKFLDSFRRNASFENGKRNFGGNVRIIPMPVSFRNNMKDYQRYKPDSSKEGNKFIKNYSPHSNHGDTMREIEKVKQEMISKESQKKTPPHYTTTPLSSTATTTKGPKEGFVNKPIRFYPVEITDEHVRPFNDLIKNNPRVQVQDNDNLPMMVSYGDAKTFSKFSNRIKPTTASYPENASSNNLWYQSKPPKDHSYEVEEIIEENIRFDVEEKKEDNRMTKKPPGGRQFKFDEKAYEGIKIVVPTVMKPAKNEVLDGSINTILNNLMNPVKRVTESNEFDKSNNNMITFSSPSPKQEGFPKAKGTFISFPTLLPHVNVESSLSPDDKPQNGYAANKKDVFITPYPNNNYFSFFRASTTEEAQLQKKDDFPSHKGFKNWEPHSAPSTRKYDKLSLPPFFPEESQRNLNFKNKPKTGQKTADHFPRLFPMVKPDNLYLPEVFRNLADGFSNPDKIFPTPRLIFSEENKMSSTFSPILYDQPLNLLPTSPRDHSDQSTTPPKTTQEVLFTPDYLPEAYNNLGFEVLKNLAERKEDKSIQELFTSVPLSEFTVEDQTEETEAPDESLSTESDFFDIQGEFELLDYPDNSMSKPGTEEDQTLTPGKSSDNQQSISESVEFENLFTTAFLTGNTITGVSNPIGGESTSSSTWMAVSKDDVKFTTEIDYFEEDEDMITTTPKEFTDTSMSVDVLNTSKKDSAQESNWKNSRKMHFNQEPTKVILDNLITDDTEIDQRRSDILINDTAEDYGENRNRIPSLNYLESLKENSSHLSPGSLMKTAPESIIPIVPQVIYDLRDNKFSDENLGMLSHAFGKYWPYIQALSKNTNLDILPLIKMKNEKDLESIFTSFVLEEPKTATTVKQQDDENILDYGHAYDYLEDYKEMYQDILNQELGKENKKKIRIKRDEEDDLKTMEATREYFESIAEEQNEEGSAYIYEDVMYDTLPDDESDSSIFELMEIADLQVYVGNVTS